MVQDVIRQSVEEGRQTGHTDLIGKVQRILAETHKRTWDAQEADLKALHSKSRNERERLFPKSIRAAIRDEVTKAEVGKDRLSAGGRRHRSLVLAKERGIDLAKLAAHARSTSEAFSDIICDPPGFSSAEFLHFDLDDLRGDVLDVLWSGDEPNDWAIYRPTYPFAMEVFHDVHTSGAGHMTHDFAYVNLLTSRMGSRLEAVNTGDDDYDHILARRENGYGVEYTCTRDGYIQVVIDLTAVLCRHHIFTEDEWGWSSVRARTEESLFLAFFSNLDDAEPASQLLHNRFVPGLSVDGDGESHPGSEIGALPGERRILSLTSPEPFQSGQRVIVHVGLLAYLNASIDDVSINFGINSVWHLNSLAVRST